LAIGHGTLRCFSSCDGAALLPVTPNDNNNRQEPYPFNRCEVLCNAKNLWRNGLHELKTLPRLDNLKDAAFLDTCSKAHRDILRVKARFFVERIS
jgi:hypothetical protein